MPEKCYVWNKIYKLSKLKNLGMEFEPNVYYEDRCFTAKALIEFNSLVVVPDVYYNYWTNSNSIVKTKSEKKIQDACYTKKKMMQYLKDNNVSLEHHYFNMNKHKLFGLTIIKTKEYKDRTEYLLFNQIKFSIKK